MKKLFVLLFFLSYHMATAQCAMCKAVVESGSASEAEGLNTGIVYLMVFPYLLVGTFLYLIIKNSNKNKI